MPRLDWTVFHSQKGCGKFRGKSPIICLNLCAIKLIHGGKEVTQFVEGDFIDFKKNGFMLPTGQWYARH